MSDTAPAWGAGGVPGAPPPEHAHRVDELVELLRREATAPAERYAIWVPGRIELLGKHTDYAGGRSLLCATERGISLVVAPRADGRLVMRDARSGERLECDLRAVPDAPAGHWSAYPLTVARRLARELPGPLRGADIAFRSDLPQAAGMSSSSAVVVGTFLALAAVNSLEQREPYRRAIPDRPALAEYLGGVENGRAYGPLAADVGVGTLGGCEDHAAILCAQPNALLQASFCPVRLERSIAVPGDLQFVVAASGVVAEKSGAARERYNRASRGASTIRDLWNRASGRGDATLAAALDSSPDAAERIREALREGRADGFSPSELLDRFEHFRIEHGEIIIAAGDALARDDRTSFGALIDRSQDAAERLLGNQIAETVFLAREARTLGAVAASAFGAGFGGSVWALVPSDGAQAFAAAWADRYRARFPGHAAAGECFLTRAAAPARVDRL